MSLCRPLIVGGLVIAIVLGASACATTPAPQPPAAPTVPEAATSVPAVPSAAAPTAAPTATPALPTPTLGPVAAPTSTEPPAAPTSAATAAPAPTETSAPAATETTAPAATATAPAPATATAPAPAAMRVNFPAGATSTTLAGNLPAGGSIRYVLGVGAGQVMEVTADPPTGLQLAVRGADGRVLKPAGQGGTSFRVTVPSTQDYFVDLTAGSGAVSYTLNVLIPARITFAPGTSESVVQGQLSAHTSRSYVARIAAGQLVDASATSAQPVQLVIYGVDGNVLKSPMGEGAAFRGTVPTTQDYIFTLNAGDAAVSYNFQVLVPARIKFAPGGTSTNVQATLAAGGADHYVLKAGAGQTMTVNATTTQGEVILIIYGADGMVLLTDHAGAASWSGALPSTQDYLVDVRSVGSVAAKYKLTVTIPPA